MSTGRDCRGGVALVFFLGIVMNGTRAATLRALCVWGEEIPDTHPVFDGKAQQLTAVGGNPRGANRDVRG